MEILFWRKNKGSICDDDGDLAPIKAAAWAWFQRRSGSATYDVRESSQVMSKAHQAAPAGAWQRGPSRYKVEATRWSGKRGSTCDDEVGNKSSLLDWYETERISMQLRQYFLGDQPEGMTNRSERVGLIIPKRDHQGVVDDEEKMRRRRKKGNKLLKGRLGNRSGGVTCGGSRRDVDETALLTMQRNARHLNN